MEPVALMTILVLVSSAIHIVSHDHEQLPPRSRRCSHEVLRNSSSLETLTVYLVLPDLNARGRCIFDVRHGHSAYSPSQSGERCLQLYMIPEPKS